MTCAHWTPAAGHCGAPDTRPYLTGPACPAHTPAALADRPEPDSLVDPALTLDGRRETAGHLYSYIRNDTAARDQRARDKGQAVSPARRALWREAEAS